MLFIGTYPVVIRNKLATLNRKWNSDYEYKFNYPIFSVYRYPN